MRLLKTILLLIIGLLATGLTMAASDQEMLEFEDDWEERAAEVNEGELHILELRTDLPEHYHQSKLLITRQSLATGWVDMHQCHENLDATSALQVVFKPGTVRELRITSFSKIEKAWVENNTVQLENIPPGSSLCLSLKTRALHREDERILLKNGPFMRRFLDGYYPMRISIQVDFPSKLLQYVATNPKGVTYQVDGKRGRLVLDARFEGRLNTEIIFERVRVENQ